MSHHRDTDPMQNRLKYAALWHLAGTVAVTKMHAATTTTEAMITRAEKYITFRLANEIRSFSSQRRR